MIDVDVQEEQLWKSFSQTPVSLFRFLCWFKQLIYLNRGKQRWRKEVWTDKRGRRGKRTLFSRRRKSKSPFFGLRFKMRFGYWCWCVFSSCVGKSEVALNTRLKKKKKKLLIDRNNKNLTRPGSGVDWREKRSSSLLPFRRNFFPESSSSSFYSPCFFSLTLMPLILVLLENQHKKKTGRRLPFTPSHAAQNKQNNIHTSFMYRNRVKDVWGKLIQTSFFSFALFSRKQR